MGNEVPSEFEAKNSNALYDHFNVNMLAFQNGIIHIATKAWPGKTGGNAPLFQPLTASGHTLQNAVRLTETQKLFICGCVNYKLPSSNRTALTR